MRIPCKIYKFKRNSRSNWLLLIAQDIVILQMQGKELFYELHPKHLKDSYFIKNGVDYDLVYNDKHNFRVSFEAINKRPLKQKQVKEFLNQIPRLPKGVRNRLKEKHNIK